MCEFSNSPRGLPAPRSDEVHTNNCAKGVFGAPGHPQHRLGLYCLGMIWPITALTLSPPVLGNSSPFTFENHASRLGVNFRHDNGARGDFRFPEIAGAGVAVADFDNDGDYDIYLVQGASPDADNLTDKLFRNNLIPSGQLSFTDVTEQSGIKETGYGMGVATGDYNQDGLVDLFVTNVGRNALYRNLGQGRFELMPALPASGKPQWSTSATFTDLNADGWPDIFITNYVSFDAANAPRCHAPSSRRDYCGPASFPAQSDQVLLNDGNGSFRDATLAILGSSEPRPGLGVVARDFNGDGWQDVYVANDGAANQLWINRQGKHLVEDGLFAGLAVNARGQAEASMGIAVADVDRDGDDDVFVTHLTGETNTLYLNNGDGTFVDQTAALGLAASSMRYTGWGTGWLDLNEDGWLDLLVANGAVTLIESQVGEAFPFKQRNQAFLSLKGSGFSEVTDRLGPQEIESSRGLSLGDLDNDGDLDLVINDINAQAKVLLNEGQPEKRWIGVDVPSTGRMTATRVGLRLPDQTVSWRTAATDGSYASANDPRVVFYLQGDPFPVQVVVRWRDGHVSRHHELQPNAYTVLTRPKTDASP